MDPLNENVCTLFIESPDQFVSNLWKDAKIVSLGSMAGGNDTPFGGGIRSKRAGMFRTVGALYKEQLSKLMTTLRNTNPKLIAISTNNKEFIKEILEGIKSVGTEPFVLVRAINRLK